MSFDDGNHWQSLQLNLPQSPVHDLVVKDNDLVVATHGRAFWILDDIEPLRELNARIAASDAYLFKPSEAISFAARYLSRYTSSSGNPGGRESPAGAIIDYYLKSPVPEKLALEIYDHDGSWCGHSRPMRLHRAPVATRIGEPMATDSRTVAEQWGIETLCVGPAISATGRPGAFLRCVWNSGQNGGEPLGPFVLPGQYEVRINLGGRVLRQPLTGN